MLNKTEDIPLLMQVCFSASEHALNACLIAGSRSTKVVETCNTSFDACAL